MGTPAVHERPARPSSSGQAKQPSRLPGFRRWPPPCWPAPPLPTQHIMTQFWVGVPGSPGAISGPKELEDLFGRTPPPIHVQKAYFLGCVWRGHECAPDAFTCILAMYPTLLGFVTGRGLENTPKAKPKYKDFRISVFCSGCWAGCPRAFETLHVYLNSPGPSAQRRVRSHTSFLLLTTPRR